MSAVLGTFAIGMKMAAAMMVTLECSLTYELYLQKEVLSIWDCLIPTAYVVGKAAL
jgi:hypothetical protein